MPIRGPDWAPIDSQNASSDFVSPGQYCTNSCQQTVEAEFELGVAAQIIGQLT